MDISRFIQGPLYNILIYVIELLWNFNRYFLFGVLQLDQFNQWIIENAGDILDIVGLALQGPAGIALVIAFTLYGLWRITSTIFPNLPWRPVELPKIIVYGVAMGLFFSAPAAGMVAIDTVRTMIATELGADVYSSVTFELVPDGYTSSEAPLILTSIATTTGNVGIQVASSFLQIQDVNEYGSSSPPQAFQDQYTPNDTYEFENLNPDDRTDAIGVVFSGIGKQFFAPLMTTYAYGEALIWTVLNVGVMILWLGLPIALIFSPFTASEAIFKTFVAKYIAILIETIVTAIVIGITGGLLTAAAQYGEGFLFGMIILAGCIAFWRLISAFKAASTAATAIGGTTAALSGGQSARDGAKTLGAVAAVTAGAAMTGGASLAMGLNARTFKQMDGSDKNKFQGQYDEAQSDARRWAGAGGYLMGHSSTAANVMGKAQQARLISGKHSPANGMDSIDAAYLGSRMSSDGAAYMTTSMMGGPSNAFKAMGYKTFQPPSQMGMGSDGGVDENGDVVDEAHSSTGGSSSSRKAANNGSRGNGNKRASSSASSNGTGSGSSQGSDIANDSGDKGSDGSSNGSSAETSRSNSVTFNPAPGAEINGWIDKVEKAKASDIMHGNLVGAAQKAYHPAADKIADMVDTHGAENVKSASQSVRQAVSGYKAKGLDNSQIAAKFRSGEAQQAIQASAAESEDTNPVINDTGNLNQVAAFTMRPVTTHSGGQIVSALGSTVDEPKVTTAARMEGYALGELDSDGQFGGYTATARSIVAGSREMGVSGNQLTNAYAHYQSGDIQGARNELATAPNSSVGGINKMMTNFKAIPTTARLSTDIRDQGSRVGGGSAPNASVSLTESSPGTVQTSVPEPEWDEASPMEVQG